MKRRDFLTGAALVATGALTRVGLGMEANARRVYRVLGVPLRSGSLYPGSENDAQVYRDAHLIDRLRSAGLEVIDEGDVAIPNYLPHHSVPPIRSWPGPRIAWECVAERVGPHLERGEVPLLIGCDCSVVVGTTQALMKAAGADRVHVIYVDGDFDDAPPEAARVNSAASVGVWLLTHESPFWAGPVLKETQVTVMGWTNPSRSSSGRASAVSRQDVEGMGGRTAAQRVLDGIPKDAAVVLHFDIDVMRAAEMPAAYFPHEQGLTLGETAELMRVLLQDPRVRIIEVSEYAALRDGNQQQINKLIDLMVSGLKA
jgi:arginase